MAQDAPNVQTEPRNFTHSLKLTKSEDADVTLVSAFHQQSGAEVLRTMRMEEIQAEAVAIRTGQARVREPSEAVA